MTILILWETGFPFVDTCPVTQESLRSLGENGEIVQFLSLSEMAGALSTTEALFVNPYGSAFPKSLWSAFYDFVNRGGCWLNLGGAPLKNPVRATKSGGWFVEVDQTGYSKQLLINQAFPIQKPYAVNHAWAGAWKESSASLSTPAYSEWWSLQVRFTDMKDFHWEHGTGGSRDANIETLLYGYLGEKPLCAPIIAIDRLRGRFAGGRWLFVNANLNEPLDKCLLQSLAQHASIGSAELDVRPSFACVYPGEQPSLLVRLMGSHRTGEGTLQVTVQNAQQETLQTVEQTVRLAPHPTHYRVPLSLSAPDPGYYGVQVRLHSSESRVEIVRETGFWVYDEALLTSASPFTLNRDYFERDGKPYPIMGTTYMSGDKHRKFLFEPNPAVWERDFAAMKRAGVNWVRTGLWTAWKRVMLDPGAVDEGVLRAFTAFLLSARKHDIPVTFNFFAFWPEEWGGENPYLDPRAIQAHQELISAFTQRFGHVPDLSWDFINEPSATSPARVWSMRPNYDTHEQKAWQKWLREQEANFSEEEREALSAEDVWRERWRLSGNDALALPDLRDFQDEHIHQGTHPLRALTYRLFAQRVFANWSEAMASAVRNNGNPVQRITVGQDEGGIWDRPNPHFFADSVDFTTNHTWWQNDDLLWDSIITKPPHKPNVSQETGIMFYEKVDGTHWRTPEDAARLLSRKLALSFAGGCAGAIQWLWNTNIYMDSDNEVGIGFHRADGTEKPELEAFRGIAQFVTTHAERFKDRVLEEVCLIIPHSAVFSTRGQGDRVSRIAVRTLESRLGVPVRAVSEYFPEHIGAPKLILLPSPNGLDSRCWEAVLRAVEQGATLLVTGPLDRDPYMRPVPRLSALDGTLHSAFETILRHEPFTLAREVLQGVFGGDKLQRLEKQNVMDSEGKLQKELLSLSHGAGAILYTGLPLELSENDSLVALYRHACGVAGITVRPQNPEGITVRRVEYRDSLLFLVYSEASSTENTTVSFEKAHFTCEVNAGSAVMVFVERESGQVVGTYPPNCLR